MRKTFDLIKEAIEIEKEALERLPLQQTCDFDALIDMILKSSGRVVVTGIGKSGIIGKKISTTFASTGTPSLFLHPVEALHGDLGMLSEQDIFLMISYSGETEEILRLIPHAKNNGSKIISMTGNPQSSLARHSDFHINIHVDKEACPLRLAPTSSTTATLVMGDALSAALIQKRGFKEEKLCQTSPRRPSGKNAFDECSRCDAPKSLAYDSRYDPLR
jgi:arabinose-5-phosphate isomerase